MKTNQTQTRTKKELKANAARRRVASDVRELARSGDVLVDRSQVIARVAAPVLVGVAVVGGLLLARRAFQSSPDFPRRRSFAAELLRRATLSLVSVAVARWAQATPLLDVPAGALPRPHDRVRSL
jgi:hypothetical protein